MRDHRTTVTFSPDDLERCNKLQEVLGTRSRSETLAIAVQMALALKTDPIATLAAAGVHFTSEISIDLTAGCVIIGKRGGSRHSVCCNCGKVFSLAAPGWYEVDAGDLCPECAKMLDYDPALDD